MNDTIRAALVNVIRSNRQKLSRSQRQKGIKPLRWLYPLATEMFYAKVIRAWLRPLIAFVHSYLKENQADILRGDSAGFHADTADEISVSRLDAVSGRSFKAMIDTLNGWLAQYVPADDESRSGSPMYRWLGKIADSVFDFNEKQFEKGAMSVLNENQEAILHNMIPHGDSANYRNDAIGFENIVFGNIGPDVYKGEWWLQARENWARFNYEVIQSDMCKYVRDLNSLVERAVTSGLSVRE